MERIRIDFMGRLQSRSKNIYLLIAVDEYPQYPSVIPCSHTSSSTVINASLKYSLFVSWQATFTLTELLLLCPVKSQKF